MLDAGCGAGRDTNLLSQKGLRVTGLDISKRLLDFARKQYPLLSFVEGDMRQLPFSTSKFDGIWAHTSLLHLETVKDVRKAFSELARVVRQGGILHVLVKAQKGKEKTAVATDTLSQHDRFFQYFTKEEIQSYLEENGFTVIKIEQYREVDRVPYGRPEVELILALARKI